MSLYGHYLNLLQVPDEPATAVRGHVQPHLAARDQQLEETGRRMMKRGFWYFFASLIYALAINVPFLAGEYVTLGDENTNVATILASISYAFNISTVLAVMVCFDLCLFIS